MDHWHAIIVRAAAPDVVQRWARLEAKSPAMREELARRYALEKPARRRLISHAAFYSELLAVAIKTWWWIRSS
jgi:hypothetical protein